jgi:hypothetical protein
MMSSLFMEMRAVPSVSTRLWERAAKNERGSKWRFFCLRLARRLGTKLIASHTSPRQKVGGLCGVTRSPFRIFQALIELGNSFWFEPLLDRLWKRLIELLPGQAEDTRDVMRCEEEEEEEGSDWTALGFLSFLDWGNFKFAALFKHANKICYKNNQITISLCYLWRHNKIF